MRAFLPSKTLHRANAQGKRQQRNLQISPPAPLTAFICLPHVDAKNKSAWVGRFLAVSNDVACDGRSTDESDQGHQGVSQAGLPGTCMTILLHKRI